MRVDSEFEIRDAVKMEISGRAHPEAALNFRNVGARTYFGKEFGTLFVEIQRGKDVRIQKDTRGTEQMEGAGVNVRQRKG